MNLLNNRIHYADRPSMFRECDDDTYESIRLCAKYHHNYMREANIHLSSAAEWKVMAHFHDINGE